MSTETGSTVGVAVATTEGNMLSSDPTSTMLSTINSVQTQEIQKLSTVDFSTDLDRNDILHKTSDGVASTEQRHTSESLSTDLKGTIMGEGSTNRIEILGKTTRGVASTEQRYTSKTLSTDLYSAFVETSASTGSIPEVTKSITKTNGNITTMNYLNDLPETSASDNNETNATYQTNSKFPGDFSTVIFLYLLESLAV